MKEAKALAKYLVTQYPFLNEDTLIKLIKEEMKCPGGDPEVGYFLKNGEYNSIEDKWIMKEPNDA